MSGQYTRLPVATVTSTNPSIGATGATAPVDATYVGGQDNSGNLQGLQLDSSKNLKVAVQSVPADQSVNLTKVGGAAITEGQKAMATSVPVVLASDQSAIPASQSGTWDIRNVTGTVSLPTGASTSTIQTNGTQKTQIVDGSGNVIAATSNALNVQVANFPASQTVAGTVTANQGTANATPWNENIAQFGGNAVVTGTGASGNGIPRVTVSNDSAVNAQIIPSSASTNANSSVASTALEASHVIKNAAGRLYQLVGVNTSTSAQYIQVFNSTSVPGDGTAPVLLAYVPGNANFSWDFSDIGRYFSTGISVSNSSTAATKTIGSANCWFNAEYL